jgi:hypothetical protein
MNTLSASSMAPEDRKTLAWAHEHLEHPSLAIRLTSVVGTPIETGLKLLPKRWYDRLHDAVEAAIDKALTTAIEGLHNKAEHHVHDRYYKLLAASTGAFGGALGLPGLLIDLPVSTTIMLRSIADIARSEGEDLSALETRLACMEVFALGGRSEEDDAAEAGYYGLRLALALSVTSATHYVVRHGLKEGGPSLVGLIAVIVSRFGAQVSRKAAAIMVPLIGALGGATVNLVFMQHFQDMARSHFAIRRLERRYGQELIQREYDRLSE